MELGSISTGMLIGFVIFLLLWKYFLPSYISEKGKNLATKQDIEEITKKVEDIKHQYTVLQEQLKLKNQLKMSVLDKRLEAHQQAFKLWRDLVSDAFDEKLISKTVMICQEFWDTNCLYLEPSVRAAFKDAYSAAHFHRLLVENNHTSAETVEKNWKRVIRFNEVLFPAMALPPLNEEELKPLDDKKPQ